MAQAVPISSGNTSTINWNGESWSGSYYPIIADNEHTYILGKEAKEMRGLFHVYVVDHGHDQVIAEGHIIADDEAKAKMKALHQWNDAVANYDLDDLDIICVKLGSVRKKKEVQEVKILKE